MLDSASAELRRPSALVSVLRAHDATATVRRPVQYLRATTRAGKLSTTLVISPLLSLMEDQAMAMRALGISVVALHSETLGASKEWEKAMRGEYDLVYTTPESAISRLAELQTLHSRGLLDLLAIDEAHTVRRRRLATGP